MLKVRKQGWSPTPADILMDTRGLSSALLYHVARMSDDCLPLVIVI